MGLRTWFHAWLAHRHLPWRVALLALLFCLPCLQLDRQIDDHMHRATLTGSSAFPQIRQPFWRLFAFVDGNPAHIHEAMDAGVLPWWTHGRLCLSFFRPVAGFTHRLDYTLWPDSAFLMHLQSLLWFAAMVAAAAVLYRRIMPCAWIAGLAALMFALDDAHAMPAMWIANRNALIALLMVILTIIGHDSWRRFGKRSGLVLATMALAVGLLANEGALTACGYVFAYALFVDRSTWRSRVLSLMPCMLVAGVWAILYRLQSYGAVGSGVYIDPGADPVRFLGALVQRAPLIFLGQFAFPPADLGMLLSLKARFVFWLICVLFAVVLAAAFLPLLRRDAAARFWATGMLLAVVPTCATFPSDRLLMYIGLGGMGLLAQWLGAVGGRASWLPRRRLYRIPLYAVAVAFLFVHLVVSPLKLAGTPGDLRAFGRAFDYAADSLPEDDAVADQTVLIVNTPTAFFSVFGPVAKSLWHDVVPKRSVVMGSSIYATKITRPDQHTLVLRPEGGFLLPPGAPIPGEEAAQPVLSFRHMLPLFDLLFRDPAVAMPVGHRIILTGLTIEVRSCTPDGRPSEVAFRFAQPLEHPCLRFVRWEGGGYVPFLLPAVGESMTLPPPDMRISRWE